MEDGFNKIENIYLNLAITAGRIESLYTPSAEAAMSFGIAVIYVYGANLYLGLILTIGDIILLLTIPYENVTCLSEV